MRVSGDGQWRWKGWAMCVEQVVLCVDHDDDEEEKENVGEGWWWRAEDVTLSTRPALRRSHALSLTCSCH